MLTYTNISASDEAECRARMSQMERVIAEKLPHLRPILKLEAFQLHGMCHILICFQLCVCVKKNTLLLKMSAYVLTFLHLLMCHSTCACMKCFSMCACVCACTYHFHLLNSFLFFF